jgi:hypothetical protein
MSEMRRLMNLLEDGNLSASVPDFEKYISKNPDLVYDSKEALLDDLRRHAADASRFSWAIGQLPDGRFIEASPRLLRGWGFRLVDQGDQDDL